MPSVETPADIFTRLYSLEGSSNTFKTHKNISLYFKRRYLIIYNYYIMFTHLTKMTADVATINSISIINQEVLSVSRVLGT